MLIAAKVITGIVLLIHVYIVILETVLFQTRGRKVFQLKKDEADVLAPAMSNQGCYNGFLVAALAIGLMHPVPAIGQAFTIFGLVCVSIAGIWGAVTVQRSILFVQTIPALLALLAYWIAA